MTRKLLMITVLWLSMFIVSSCDPDLTIKTATFYVHNDSQYQVTEVSVPLRTLENGFYEILEPGENCTLISEWVDGKTISTEIFFRMDGKDYGCKEYGEAMTDTVRSKPYKRITDGDTVIIHIYDNHWEWWKAE